MLYRMLLIIIIGSALACSKKLPEDFPKPPALTICTPISKDGIFLYWGCENTVSREQTTKPLDSLQIAISATDWNLLNSYRIEVENWVIKRCSYKELNRE